MSERLHTCGRALGCAAYLEVLADTCVLEKHVNASVHTWKGTYMFKHVMVIHAVTSVFVGSRLWAISLWACDIRGIGRWVGSPFKATQSVFSSRDLGPGFVPGAEGSWILRGEKTPHFLCGAAGCFGGVLGVVAVKWRRAVDEKPPWRCEPLPL